MTKKAIVIAVLWVLMPHILPAQDLTATNLSYLEFGNEIFPGSPLEISRLEARAAAFKVTGEAGRQVHVTFQLPGTLNQELTEDLQVSFSSTDGGYHTSEAGQSNATAFDPSNGVVATLSTTGELYIWLGGTVHPYSYQPDGYYSADITLSVSYTTN